jgi:hypothetical protein
MYASVSPFGISANEALPVFVDDCHALTLLGCRGRRKFSVNKRIIDGKMSHNRGAGLIHVNSSGFGGDRVASAPEFILSLRDFFLSFALRIIYHYNL